MHHYSLLAFFLFCAFEHSAGVTHLGRLHEVKFPPPPCHVANNARGIEGLLRTIRLVVKLTDQTELQNFLVKKAEEIRSAISMTYRLFQIFGDGMEKGSSFARSFPSGGAEMEMLRAQDSIQRLYSYETRLELQDFEEHANQLYKYIFGDRYTQRKPEEVMKDVETAIDFAIERCQFIYKNGCGNQTEMAPWP